MSGFPNPAGTDPISCALPAAGSGASVVPPVPCPANGIWIVVVVLLIVVGPVSAVPVVTDIQALTMRRAMRSKGSALSAKLPSEGRRDDVEGVQKPRAAEATEPRMVVKCSNR